MTVQRQRGRGIGAALLLAANLAVPFAHAAEVPAAPEPAVAESVAPKPAPAKPAAPKADPKRAWLRSAAAPTKAPPPSSGMPYRMLAFGAVVAGLGAVALLKRRRKAEVARATRSDLEVVSAARVGNKAEVVVLSVGGRKMLLGVTEAEVTRLAWLDAELDAAEGEPDEALAMPGARTALSAPARTVLTTQARTAVTAPTATPEPARRFRDVLMGALGQPRRAPEPASATDAAVLIAEGTEDVIGKPTARVAAPAGAPEMVDIEGQARGLVLRLQKRA
jgi:flagellar biogenesis protein FliO